MSNTENINVLADTLHMPLPLLHVDPCHYRKRIISLRVFSKALVSGWQVQSSQPKTRFLCSWFLFLSNGSPPAHATNFTYQSFSAHAYHLDFHCIFSA